MKYTILHRRGSTAQWNDANPVLAFGEVGVEKTETGLRSKIGDGTTPWANLAYVDDRALAEAVSAETKAFSYADAGDATTLASAKNHADSADAATLASAKNYTDAKTTGVAALLIDTGWRNITALSQDPASSGALYIRREGKRVYVHANALTYASNMSFARLGTILPNGFRPPRTTDFATGRRLAADNGGSIRIDASGAGYVYQVAANMAIYGIGSFLTDDPAPATLPGAPA